MVGQSYNVLPLRTRINREVQTLVLERERQKCAFNRDVQTGDGAATTYGLGVEAL